MSNFFYVYAYIRKNGSPYYIGKGTGNRAWIKGKDEIGKPTERRRILILEDNLTEIGAFALERRMIRWYGRKDIKTGCLRNMTDGGEGCSGRKNSNETREKISESKIGIPSPLRGKRRPALSIACRGIPKTETTKLKMRKPKSETHKENIRQAQLHNGGNGPENHSVETIAKIKNWLFENSAFKQKVTCPHCNKEGGNGPMKRFHFDNCKERNK